MSILQTWSRLILPTTLWVGFKKNLFFPSCVGKNPVSPTVSFLSCVSPVCSLHSYTTTMLTQNTRTSDTFGHQTWWEGFPTTSNSLWHRLGVLQVNSILTLPTQRQCQIPKVTRSVSPEGLSAYLQMPVTCPDNHLCFRPTCYWL